jgi:hypothetical protein
MEHPEFNITITRNGKVKVHVEGVKGQRCVELADLIKEIVGHEEERLLTSDYYAQEGKVKIHTDVSVHRSE